MNPFEMRLNLVASGPVPVALAWRRYARPALWPTWSPQLRSVEITGDGQSDEELVVGLTGRVFGPLGVHADFTVVSLDAAAHRWSWVVRRGPLAVRLHHALEARPGRAGSRTTLELQGPLPLVLGYSPIAYYALHRLVTLPDPTDA
jgi:hypothetical protein